MSRTAGMNPSPARLDHSAQANSTAAGKVQPAGRSLSHLVLPSPALTCPGESHSISHSVHLARLASGYAGCRQCVHNPAAAAASPVPAGHVSRHSRAARTLVTAEGVRGVYLNELDRTRAGRWGAAFASLLWDEQPRIGRGSADPAPASARRGPVVVIGFDERPASPDMVMGVALGLRRMGCQVIDLGQTTRPCFHFAVHHLESAGGVLVTGTGCDPAWTGFHFAGRGSLPLLRTDVLNELERRSNAGVNRPTRTAGVQRPFHAAVPYQAGLWKLFHALRPLKVVCGTATRQLPRILDALFSRLPCRLTHEPLPVRRRGLADQDDPDVCRVAAATIAAGHDLGIVIDDDGERCAFVTERGQLVPVEELARLLILFELHEHRAARLVVDETLFPDLAGWLASTGRSCQVEQAPAADLPASLVQYSAGLGIGSQQRIWFGGAYPTCNAIQTLARVLQALSLSDAPMSEVIRRAA